LKVFLQGIQVLVIHLLVMLV